MILVTGGVEDQWVNGSMARPVDKTSEMLLLLLTARAPEGISPTDAPRTQHDTTRQQQREEKEARSPRYGERHA